MLTFHHVGIGTTNFESAIDVYRGLGHTLFRSVDDELLNVRVAFLACPGGGSPWIEILAPLRDGGPLESLIKRRVLPAPYHTCYAVQDLDPAIHQLRQQKFIPIIEPQSALAFDNARIVFLYHAAVGLVELVERPPLWDANELAGSAG